MNQLPATITKKTTTIQDYEIFNNITQDYLKAYGHSKQTLASCAVGQAGRRYNSAINAEMKVSRKYMRVSEKLAVKYPDFFMNDKAPCTQIVRDFKEYIANTALNYTKQRRN